MIDIDLGPELEAFVASLVEEGRFGSVDEVLREAVCLVQNREAKLIRLDAAIARGIADGDAGRTVPAEEVFDRLKRKYRKMAEGRAASMAALPE